MRVCLEDCMIDGLALPKWMHVCPVCKSYTYDLDEIERAMQEVPNPIEFVEKEELREMLRLLSSNQDYWDEKEFEFVAEMRKKYEDVNK